MPKKSKFGKLIKKIGKNLRNKLVKNKKTKTKAKKRIKKSPKKARSRIKRRPIKKTRKKVLKRKISKSKPITPSYGKPIGEVVHYFTNLGVGVIKLNNTLNLKDKLLFKGATTDFKQKIMSMQIEREPISQAKKGQEVGILLKSRVRIGDKVFVV